MIYKEFQSTDFESIPKGEKINARILYLENDIDFKIFVFSEKVGTYSCLLPVTNTTEKLPELNGLLIKYEQFKMPGSELRWYVLIECSAKAYLLYFTDLLKEIASEIEKGNFGTIKCLNLVISKWRHFLAVPALQILSEENIIGLCGELLLLKSLLSTYGAEAIGYWIGSAGDDDFLIGNKIIEVKTTLKQKHEHIINGIDQLLIKPDTFKIILSLLLVKADTSYDLNLPHLINQCAENIVESPGALDSFYVKLKSRGYDHRDSYLYQKFSFILFRGGYFKIDNTFPKLTTHELAYPLNSRISKVRYTIDMEGLPNKDFNTTLFSEIL